MSADLTGTTIAVLATDGVEQIELTTPRQAFEEAGANIVLVSLEEGDFTGYNHLEAADTFKATKAVADADVSDYDALLLPGGVANPDALRMDSDAVAFVKGFMASGKPVAAICHAAWTLIEADAVAGRTLTSWPSLQTDIRNAGGDWKDEEVVRDGNLVTSRKPDDLEAFCAASIDMMAGS